MRTETTAPPVPVVFDGELDIASLDTIDAQLGTAMRTDTVDVLVESSGVTFIDASALGALVDAANCLAVAERTLRLLNPSPCVQRIIKLTQLDELLLFA